LSRLRRAAAGTRRAAGSRASREDRVRLAMGGVKRFALPRLEPGHMPIGRNDLHRRADAPANRDSVLLVSEVDDNLLALAQRGGLAKIVGVAHHPVLRGVAYQEGIGLIHIAVQFERRPVEQRGAHELAIFQILKTLTRRFADVLLHVIRIGKRCKPLVRL
jgi:hypothetical protein